MADEDDIIEVISNINFIKTQKVEFKSHHVFFDQEIGYPSQYRDLIHMLYCADDMDRFTFFMNSEGGQLYAAQAIIEAMKQSSATIHGVIVGQCHSAASLILLNCDEVTVTDSAEMMVHSASYGAVGSTHGIKRQANFFADQWHKVEVQTYKHFLTDQEIEDVGKGLEFWLNADQIKTRLKRRVAAKETKPAKKVKKDV
jgi:ATP-dependent protease ClpP protease subunit